MEDLARLFGRDDVLALEREVPGRDTRDNDVGVFNEHIRGELARLTREVDAPQAADERLGIHGSMLRTTVLHRLEERIGVGVAVRDVQFTIGTGCRLIGTPYDVEYSEGTAFGFGAKHDGKVVSIGTEGQAAGGVGFYLSSPAEVDMSITPQGTYEFSWFAAAEAPDWRSFGGLGVTIYADGDSTPVFTRQVRLWDVHGAGLLQGGTGKGAFASASSPALPGGFGPIPLAPVIVRMQPGRRLLVWMWSWQISNRVDATLALLSTHVPAVQLCGSPPLVIH
ncbi:hypothetical protein FE251_09705 [Georgenia wutianyii]|uniref:Uncharacterized protein n=1 Tax=Georgenia wutianyii TaxID=2585135 RepID=A0ABX5VPL8_9MICO|nr:hypothetical protein [Georgenia wutianyii]QDB79616.1 hypothetical protein FE251_09705 [Georgenia wutianyii]